MAQSVNFVEVSSISGQGSPGDKERMSAAGFMEIASLYLATIYLPNSLVIWKGGRLVM